MSKPQTVQATTPSVLQSESKVLNYFTRAVVILIALGAAVLSFDALSALAVEAGVPVSFAWIWAVVIDGFILVATFAAFALRDRKGGGKIYAWTTLFIFVLFSILGNAWHAIIVKADFELPLWAAVIVTAIPPLALFLSIHLFIIMTSPTPEQKLAFKREQERKDRIYQIQKSQIEAIEELKAINDLRVEAGLEPLTELPGKTIRRPATPKKPVALTTAPKAKPSTSKPNKTVQVAKKDIEEKETINTTQPEQPKQVEETPQIATPPTFNNEKTEEEIFKELQALVDSGKMLPTGKALAEQLGKSERTGQKLVKKFKEEVMV